MNTPFQSKTATIWIVAQRCMFNDMLRRSIQKQTEFNCRFAPALEDLPWREQSLDAVWVILFDTLKMDTVALMALLQTRESRRNCLKALYNVYAADQLLLERHAFHSGWHGVFSIGIGLEKMIRGVKDLIEGRLWFRREVLSHQAPERQAAGAYGAHNGSPLTEREQQVLSVIAKGATNQEISVYLKISQHTVKTHIYNIYQKINVPNRLQAAIWASQNLERY